MSDKSFLCIFCYYIIHCHSIEDSIGYEWWSISADELHSYQTGPAYQRILDGFTPIHMPLLTRVLHSFILGNIPQWPKDMHKMLLIIWIIGTEHNPKMEDFCRMNKFLSFQVATRMWFSLGTPASEEILNSLNSIYQDLSAPLLPSTF